MRNGTISLTLLLLVILLRERGPKNRKRFLILPKFIMHVFVFVYCVFGVCVCAFFGCLHECLHCQEGKCQVDVSLKKTAKYETSLQNEGFVVLLVLRQIVAVCVHFIDVNDAFGFMCIHMQTFIYVDSKFPKRPFKTG